LKLTLIVQVLHSDKQWQTQADGQKRDEVLRDRHREWLANASIALPVHSFTNAHPLAQVPVIAVFTKMDALDKKEFNQLGGEGVSLKTAKEIMASRGGEIFDRDY
jgi:hypothetical protein